MWTVGVLLVLVIAASIAVAMAANEKDEFIKIGELNKEMRKQINNALKDGKLTPEELKMLVEKGAVVVATNAPEKEAIQRLSKLKVKYDLLVSSDLAVEMEKLMADEYKKKYGYHPDEVGITPDKVTKEELRRMVEEGRIKLENDVVYASGQVEILANPGDPLSPPYASPNGQIWVDVFPAKDPGHAPAAGSNLNDVLAGTTPFKNEFGVSMVIYEWYNVWDASDVGTNASDMLEDLDQDITAFFNNNIEYYQVVMGWVYQMDHNGIAYLDGHFSVCAERPSLDSNAVNWPDDSVVQHELSHNFGALDHTTIADCIMDYFDAFFGTDKWCTNCWNIVNANVWGPNG